MKFVPIIFIFLISTSFPAHSDERQICRKSLSNFNKIVECIENDIYDPCDDAGGSHARGLCATAHIEVAERKIKKYRKQFLSLFDSWKLPEERKNEFLKSEEEWKEYSKNYCNATDALANYFIAHSDEAILAMDTNRGFCLRRVTEKHVDELKFALSKIVD